MKNKTIVLLLIFSLGVHATTNLGTLNTINHGFGTLKECQKTPLTTQECDDYKGPLAALKGILNFTTTNQCLATKADFKDKVDAIPKCPQEGDKIKGLDNTYPTAGTFALYTGHNDNFIHDLAKSYLAGSVVGKFNLVLPKVNIESLKKNTTLTRLLNSKRVNIIQVETVPSVEKWMQDSFQFTTIDGKPALYQLDHMREHGQDFQKRLACELAKKCDIPYYVPPDIVDPKNGDRNSLNSGGNLEVLPGGTFYTGIIKTDGFDNNLPQGKSTPFRTKFQEVQKKSLTASGNKVLELDTSFLSVGHVDEIINIVKTNKPSPCNFAVLLASPSKAFELLEKTAEKRKKLRLDEDRCSQISYYDLQIRGHNKVLSDREVNKIYKNYCIDYEPLETFIASREFKILKRENLEQNTPTNISKIMQQNKHDLIKELKVSTKCTNPQIVDVPVFFRDGLSFTPDLVNGVVETPPDSPSNIYLPRTYFEPFDTYMKSKLLEIGVHSTFVHDMGYHLEQGEVHCGSNTARICRP